MFVVMSASATPAEANAVKSLILAEGLTPYDHAGAERVVIAVVGEIGARKPVLMSRLEALGGVESVTPISRPFKLTSREFHPEDTVIRVLDAVDRRRRPDGDGRAVLDREPRPAPRDRRWRRRGRGDDHPGRRVQATDQPLLVPGPRASKPCATLPRSATGPACR